MRLAASTWVHRPLGEAWAFLHDPANAPKWDRSIKRAVLESPPLRAGSVVETTGPSGARQRFRVTELSAPHRLRFALLDSAHFRSAELAFELVAERDGTRITHEIRLTVRPSRLLLVPVLLLVQRRALATDLEYLRRALDEGLDLQRSRRPMGDFPSDSFMQQK